MEDAAGNFVPPARGAEMRNFLQARLQKNRAPPLVHAWDFYHDRQDRSKSSTLSNAATQASEGTDGGVESYEQRLEHLAVIDDVRKFWNVFNNFDLGQLALRDSVHLFHKGVKPVWEDPRNTRGGSWTFRVPKDRAHEFWKEICMMAIGEQLQAAVNDPSRTVFRDDICGVSIGVRFNSMLIQIWNRDGDHQAGIDAILRTVLLNLSEGLMPRDGSYYYKRHREHAGFAAPSGGEAPEKDQAGDNGVEKA
ncbi:translation initiation factor eIF4e [Piedraia hortae CBS 480.64]|uniref:Translation initiation factor eIF4e n=1 Tax=Piedraia hortae CBS 480.64 TaxID=1314780 RepID=A0A6A7C6N8_9PEZI|nr:translation initiation factor eIF4e [Piedraia hortae CBS 480.64]